jgi:CHRD domain
MKRIVIVVVAFAALAGAAIAAAGFNQNFGTHLRGRTENPPRDTQAQGQALFHLSDDGLSMEYKVIVANIDNAFMAHIHIAPAGVNGPVAVWLYPSTTPGLTAPLGQGRLDGVIAEGVFTAANFTGPLSGHSMADLVSDIADGTAYVNVHTNDGVDGTNTGPGDFPGGEIRAQLVS